MLCHHGDNIYTPSIEMIFKRRKCVLRNYTTQPNPNTYTIRASHNQVIPQAMMMMMLHNAIQYILSKYKPISNE